MPRSTFCNVAVVLIIQRRRFWLIIRMTVEKRFVVRIAFFSSGTDGAKNGEWGTPLRRPLALDFVSIYLRRWPSEDAPLGKDLGCRSHPAAGAAPTNITDVIGVGQAKSEQPPSCVTLQTRRIRLGAPPNGAHTSGLVGHMGSTREDFRCTFSCSAATDPLSTVAATGTLLVSHE